MCMFTSALSDIFLDILDITMAGCKVSVLVLCIMYGVIWVSESSEPIETQNQMTLF